MRALVRLGAPVRALVRDPSEPSAQAVAKSGVQPARFIGKALEIAGDELTNPQIAASFARVMGRPVKFRKLPLFLTRLVLGKEFYQMFKWFNEEGYRADLAALRRDYPVVKPTSLEAWLTREPWKEKGATYAPHAKTFIAKIPKAS